MQLLIELLLGVGVIFGIYATFYIHLLMQKSTIEIEIISNQNVSQLVDDTVDNIRLLTEDIIAQLVQERKIRIETASGTNILTQLSPQICHMVQCQLTEYMRNILAIKFTDIDGLIQSIVASSIQEYLY
jgi:hypothetical protein